VYKVGAALDWLPEVQLGTGYPAAFRKLLHQLAELSLGGLVLGAAAAAATYAIVLALWGPARWLLGQGRLRRARDARAARTAVGEAPRPAPPLAVEPGAPPTPEKRADVDRSAH
jgi:hypothetical protein